MFQKAHKKLTVLCTILIASVLTIMTIIYLIVSEKNLKESNEASFQNDMEIIETSVDIQSIMTRQWYRTIEFNGKYYVFLTDNDIPLWINNPSRDAKRDNLYQEMKKEYSRRYENSSEGSVSDSYPVTFSFSVSSGSSFLSAKETYFAYFNIIEREKSNMTLSVIYPLQEINRQINSQRFQFILIDLITIYFLSLFSSAMIRRILEPIEANHQEQIRFVAAASHELRTPLAVILSSIEAFRHAPDEEKIGFLTPIESESKRMSLLINDMLTLARADNHTWNIEPKPIQLDTLLLNTCEAFEPLARRKNIAILITLPEEAIPDCCCDEQRIIQVITILLQNAISYSPCESKICVFLSVLDKHFIIKIEDHGPGIADEEKEKVFERFYRIDKSRNDKEHFGLGLCIAKEIMLAHNGMIQIKDTPGGGSTFICYIPISFFFPSKTLKKSQNP